MEISAGSESKEISQIGIKNIWKRILESSKNQHVSPYIVIAMERDSHFHSSYIVLAVMNRLGMAYSMQKDVCGFSANVGPLYIGDLNTCGFGYP